jgi:hypothetical protein
MWLAAESSGSATSTSEFSFCPSRPRLRLCIRIVKKRLSLPHEEISDDISSYSLQMLLVSVALCSGETHPRLTLYSDSPITVLFFLLVTDYSLLNGNTSRRSR